MHNSLKRDKIQVANIFHISIMSGIALEQFTFQVQSALKFDNIRTTRVMPNIGHQVSCGVAGNT